MAARDRLMLLLVCHPFEEMRRCLVRIGANRMRRSGILRIEGEALMRDAGNCDRSWLRRGVVVSCCLRGMVDVASRLFWWCTGAHGDRMAVNIKVRGSPEH